MCGVARHNPACMRLRGPQAARRRIGGDNGKATRHQSADLTGRRDIDAAMSVVVEVHSQDAAECPRAE
jgi:hypothetical protein